MEVEFQIRKRHHASLPLAHPTPFQQQVSASWCFHFRLPIRLNPRIPTRIMTRLNVPACSANINSWHGAFMFVESPWNNRVTWGAIGSYVQGLACRKWLCILSGPRHGTTIPCLGLFPITYKCFSVPVCSTADASNTRTSPTHETSIFPLGGLIFDCCSVPRWSSICWKQVYVMV